MKAWVDHNRIGEPTTRTPKASPAHQFSTASLHGSWSCAELNVPPTSPPNSGPIKQAAAMKIQKSRRLLRLGRRPHQASVSVAPTSGSTTVATPNPAASQKSSPKKMSTTISPHMIATTTAGHSARRLSSIAATVTPAGG